MLSALATAQYISTTFKENRSQELIQLGGGNRKAALPIRVLGGGTNGRGNVFQENRTGKCIRDLHLSETSPETIPSRSLPSVLLNRLGNEL